MPVTHRLLFLGVLGNHGLSAAASNGSAELVSALADLLHRTRSFRDFSLVLRIIPPASVLLPLWCRSSFGPLINDRDVVHRDISRQCPSRNKGS